MATRIALTLVALFIGASVVVMWPAFRGQAASAGQASSDASANVGEGVAVRPQTRPAATLASDAAARREAARRLAEREARAQAPERYRMVTVKPGASVAMHGSPGGAVVQTLADTTEFGSPQVLSVLERRGSWLGVSTPLLDNGDLGWVRFDRDALSTATTGLSLHADVSERRLELRRGDRVLREVVVAVGAPESPTPTGRFAVTDELTSGFADVYGCCVLALSATQPNPPPGWTGGNRMAVHGTYEPVGGATSAGCLRATNEDMTALLERVEAGTPIFIAA